MNIKLFFIFLFVIHVAISQKTLIGIVIDKDTQDPIEFVDIYNKEDNVSTNEDGRFIFVSRLDSIKFSILGYNSFSTIFKNIKSDTIFLIPNVEELDEIILNSDRSLFRNIRDNIVNNYPTEPYKERFFLRGVLKRNDTIVRIEDFIGLVERKTLLATKEIPRPKNNYTIELQNLRKAGIIEEDVYFKQISFEKLFDIFTTIGLQKEYFVFKEINLKDTSFVKIEFNPIKDGKFPSQGYYIINLEDYAIDEFYLINRNGFPLKEKKNFKYTTVLHEVRVKFKKDKKWNKYYIYKAKLNFKVEIQFKDSEKEFYDANYQYYTKDNFNSFNINKNISVSKDLFKIRIRYNSEFWNKQNELLLTKEMEEFLKSLNDDSNDFKVKSNMN